MAADLGQLEADVKRARANDRELRLKRKRELLPVAEKIAEDLIMHPGLSDDDWSTILQLAHQIIVTVR